MLGLRFDPALQLVATSAFDAGDAVIAAGQVFDWRARGMSELDVMALFSSGLLAHSSPLDAPIAQPAKSHTSPARHPRR